MMIELQTNLLPKVDEAEPANREKVILEQIRNMAWGSKRPCVIVHVCHIWSRVVTVILTSIPCCKSSQKGKEVERM